jgi:hypothetical protein
MLGQGWTVAATLVAAFAIAVLAMPPWISGTILPLPFQVNAAGTPSTPSPRRPLQGGQGQEAGEGWPDSARLPGMCILPDSAEDSAHAFSGLPRAASSGPD